ncbi:DUF3667 domain-containing protein [Hymenobacter sp. BT188]|uniref:DUF3667 domain-containing protein n=1 Tax=Hymenobacter sp. BT188 TaxID=2763504 RepID=UPI001650F49F|nr:DUF3667 domain-containing protein [Hymenobacter sp. BT188]MBC6607297.1 DUF3667 domain-containing protein [Hymenobacter sp. BT188]
MSTDTAVACLNCRQQLSAGSFCPNCGQRRPHRLTVGHVAHEVFHVFTHADNTIIGYIPQVLFHPGRVVDDYLAGRRKRYFNPFQFLLLVLGLTTVVAVALHYYEATGLEIQQRLAGRVPPAELARMVQYFHYLGKYYNLWWLLLALPMYSFFTWLVYRSRGVNYAESFFVHVIIGSAANLYSVVILLVIWLADVKASASTYLNSSLQVVVGILYMIFIGKHAFELSWPGAIWRAFLSVLLSMAGSYAVNTIAFRWYVFG